MALTIAPRVKMALKIAAACLVGVAAVVAAYFVGRAQKREGLPEGPSGVDRAVEAAADKIQEARAEAAVSIAVARTKDEATRAELAEVLAEPDKAARRRALIALSKRTGL